VRGVTHDRLRHRGPFNIHPYNIVMVDEVTLVKRFQIENSPEIRAHFLLSF
jgi:hypothetical protein